MGESYSQGIEKAADELYAQLGGSLGTDHTTPELIEYMKGQLSDAASAAIKAFLSAQPTIQWCKTHGSSDWMRGGICWAFNFIPMTRSEACNLVGVRIVERETP